MDTRVEIHRFPNLFIQVCENHKELIDGEYILLYIIKTIAHVPAKKIFKK